MLAAKWTERYEQLVDYKKKNNSTCVPDLYTADQQLANWVRTQRTYYKTNSSYLTTKKKQQLNSIGFIWGVQDARWTEIYDRLVAYKKQNNSTCVPVSYKADRQLAIWVAKQRIYYNTNRSQLTTDRIDRLNKIGFIWKLK